MGIQRDHVLEVIYAAVDSANEELEEGCLEKSPHTALYGKNSPLDSIGLVSLVVNIEEGLEERLGLAVTLADEKALSQENSPFRSIESLTDYILERAREASADA